MTDVQKAHEGGKRKDVPQAVIDQNSKKAKSEEIVPRSIVSADGSAFVTLLANTKVESVWTRENKIFYALRTDKVKDVFKGIIAHNFMSCPVLQKTKNKWYAFIDLADIVKFIVFKFPDQSSLESETDIHALLDRSVEFRECLVNEISKSPMAIRTPYHPIGRGYSLFAAYECMAREPSLHRIPIVDSERHLVSILTQSQLVEFAWRNIELLGSTKRVKMVGEMGYNLHEVVSIKPTDVALQAFTLMIEKNITGVAVVNNQGILIDQISLRDLKAVAPDGRLFGRLYKPVEVFLHHLKTEAKFDRPKEVVFCTKNTTLEQVISLLVNNHVHRVFVVESETNRKPIGIITLRDVLLELIPGGHW